MKPRYDYARGIRELGQADPKLAPLIERLGPFELNQHRTGDISPSLIRSIISQQLHGKSAAKIHARVLALVGDNPPPATVAKVSDPALRPAGPSGAKLTAIRDLAAKSESGRVPTITQARCLTDDQLIERLTAVRGIGPWTVHMLLIFRLGRPEIIPTGDCAIRLAFSNEVNSSEPITPAALLAYAGRWRPWRRIASWYLWRSLDPTGGT